MPLYDYKCRDHGLFQKLGTMAEAALPAECPECQQQSARVIVLPPEILAMAPEQRQAAERNEKARHEPIISTADQREHDAEHRQACGCQKRSASKPMMFYTADGKKMFPSMRPWMISH
ncbi:zinc ribbon domain-containing protein [Marinobacter salinisoli]|uniref:Zinc ribbon domain-containing protein n=1 Tax=Marinobacter salinisoli TaxID=2769486 RepID=A0ABX7MVS0_9GAMM|nr:zinc ribbon domain-containing protein [Marinobacter salinisoli]QSP95489.1 zinc ribbon domain-containing protein [Marinobacter salinisoli]